MDDYDLVIKNGTILTFEPAARFRKTDIGITGESISFIGPLDSAQVHSKKA